MQQFLGEKKNQNKNKSKMFSAFDKKIFFQANTPCGNATGHVGIEPITLWSWI